MLPDPPGDADFETVMARLKLEAEEHACLASAPEEEDEEEHLADEQEVRLRCCTVRAVATGVLH